ncbi:hypothetical protein BASA81_002372 [Batrachochytrium salamandrivorans]|nr:hypothetical protein BASA81_002372 [Batrachochytrium salamandrivorans]
MLTCEEIRNQTVAQGFIPPSERPTAAAFQRVQFVTEMILLGGFLLAFFYFKYTHPLRAQFHRIRARQTRWVVITSLGATCAIVTGSYAWSTPLESGLPCFVQIAADTNTVPMLLIPVLIRLYYFHRSDELTHVLATKPAEAESAATATLAVVARVEDDNVDASSTDKNARVVWNWFARAKGGERIEDKLLRLKLESSNAAMLLLLCVCLTPILASSVVFIALQENVTCLGCRLSEAGIIIIAVQGVLGVVFVVLFLLLVRGKRDSVGVLREIRLCMLYGGLPGLIFFILSFTVGAVGEFHFLIPVEMFCLVIVYFQTLHPCLLARRERKQVLAALDRYRLSMHDFDVLVMRPDGPYYEAFCKHMELEHSLETTAFLSAIALFEQEFYDVGPKTNQSRVRRIIAMYVGDDAVLPCNLSAEVMAEIRKSSASIEVGMFAQAKSELHKMLYLDAFFRFLATKEFQTIYQQRRPKLAILDPAVDSTKSPPI